MDKVGGDLYDVRLVENRLFHFIADVSGHGLSSSNLSLITRMPLDAVTDISSTNRALYYLNNIIHRSTVKDNYVTAFLADIDIRANKMKLCNAGNFLLIIYRNKTG